MAKFDLAKYAKVTDTGLKIKAVANKISYDDAALFLDDVVARRNSSQWAIGDAFNHLEKVFGARAYQLVNNRSVSEVRIQNYSWTCRTWVYGRRRYLPSYSHHECLNALEPDRQDYWIDRVLEEGLSVTMLRDLTAEERGIDEDGGGGSDLSIGERIDKYAEDLQKIYEDLPPVNERAYIRTAIESLEEAARTIDISIQKAEDDLVLVGEGL